MVNFGGCNNSLYSSNPFEEFSSLKSSANDKKHSSIEFHKFMTSPEVSSHSGASLDKFDLSKNKVLAERVLQILYSQFVTINTQARTRTVKDRKARLEALNNILWKIKAANLSEGDSEKQHQDQEFDDQKGHCAKSLLNHVFREIQDIEGIAKLSIHLASPRDESVASRSSSIASAIDSSRSATSSPRCFPRSTDSFATPSIHKLLGKSVFDPRESSRDSIILSPSILATLRDLKLLKPGALALAKYRFSK